MLLIQRLLKLVLPAILRRILKFCQGFVRNLLHHGPIVQKSHCRFLRVKAAFFSHRSCRLLPLVVETEVGRAYELFIVPDKISGVLYTRYVALIWRSIPGRFSSPPLRRLAAARLVTELRALLQVLREDAILTPCEAVQRLAAVAVVVARCCGLLLLVE